MREIKIWKGKYRRINFEINNFYFTDGKEQWTFYLILNLDLLPTKLRDRFWLLPHKWGVTKKNHIGYRYSDESLIRNIEWHSGCTYYEKIHGFDGGSKVIKIGCDYGHVWDIGYCYDVYTIKNDVETAINSLHKLIPNIKYHCQYCGKMGLRNYHKIREEEYYCDKCFKREHPKLLEGKE